MENSAFVIFFDSVTCTKQFIYNALLLYKYLIRAWIRKILLWIHCHIVELFAQCKGRRLGVVRLFHLLLKGVGGWVGGWMDGWKKETCRLNAYNRSIKSFDTNLYFCVLKVECPENTHIILFFADLQNGRFSNINFIFIFQIQNICCGCSKEPSQWDGSFEHP